MRSSRAPFLLLALLLGACLEGEPGAGGGAVISERSAVEPAMDVRVAVQPAAPRLAADSAGDGAPPIDSPTPQIAYAYSLQFRLPPNRLAAALDGHVAMCDALGAERCRIVSLNRSGEE
ncbi:MAG: hypothetical protein ACK4MX_08330, partial [Thermaurantiacus sp.]